MFSKYHTLLEILITKIQNREPRFSKSSKMSPYFFMNLSRKKEDVVYFIIKKSIN